MPLHSSFLLRYHAQHTAPLSVISGQRQRVSKPIVFRKTLNEIEIAPCSRARKRLVSTTSSNRARDARMSSQTAPSPAANQPAPSPSRPSSSVLLISSRNEVLLLHRVRSSNNFPSAHVFPGGNLDAFHDGEIPEPNDLARHEDGPAYRRAAIRETFEESGILLARKNGFGRLVEIDEAEREEGRKLVQKGEVPFEQWLARKGGRADAGESATWYGVRTAVRRSMGPMESLLVSG